jgi:nucleoside-diphosphate-sugar epimerase
LVIFGCGYVGAAVAKQAVAQGLEVIALTRNQAKADALKADGVAQVIVADLTRDDWHGRIAGGADFVLNCVSSGGGGIEDYRRNYLEGMNSVVTWLRGTRAVRAAVYTSSTSVIRRTAGCGSTSRRRRVEPSGPRCCWRLSTRCWRRKTPR